MNQDQQAPKTPMSVVDTAWLRMDSPDNLMVINGVLEFETPLSRGDVKAMIEERLLVKGPRFGCRPLEEDGQYVWNPVISLDWAYHLVPSVLPADQDPDTAMASFINGLFGVSLDPAHPLWRFYVVEDYKGGSAVVIRVHHCYADGIALIALMDAIADRSVLKSSPAARAALPGPHRQGDRWWHPLLHGLRQLAFRAAFAGAWLWEATRVLVLPADNNRVYKQPLSARKQVAWAPSLPVSEVKAIGKALGGTVNDVLVACAAGAMRRHLDEVGQSTQDVTVRVTVPVNLRPLEQALNLGNRFGLVYLGLPVGYDDGRARVQAVRRHMNSLKNGAQAVMSYGVLAILGFFPASIQRAALNFFSGKASAVMTNVPGPTESIWLMGARVRRSMFWVPQSGGIGIGLSILSYDHKVEFGVVADAALIADPHSLVRHFLDEFEALRVSAGISET